MKRIVVTGGLACALVGGLLAQPSAVADEVASPTAEEVGSATVVPIQVTGDPADRFNLVILGDGFTADEMDRFRDAVDHHLNVQWSMEPFRSYRNYMNVYAVEIISGESGVSCDPNLDSPRKTTPLNMSFWGGCNPNSVQRLLTMSSSAANRYASMVPGVTSANRQVLALGNSETYGGAGGANATASSHNSMSALISPHELGHSLGGLQDEYLYYARNENRGDMPGTAEPNSIHHTRMTSEEMIANQAKWWRWLGEESESGGIIRAADPDGYEGGMYYSGNVWRPSDNSNMKSLGYYYDQVSRERMTQRLSARTPLIDSSTPTGQSVAVDEVIWVQVLHPVYHELDIVWRINGEVVANTDNSGDLDLGPLDVSAGDEVTVTVQDPTEFVRDPAIRNSSAMTRTRSWTVGNDEVIPSDTEVEITTSTPTDRPAGHDEVVFIETTHASDRVFDVTWRLNGEVVSDSTGKTLPLADLNLDVGAHTLTATVTDPAGPGSDSISWVVDNVGPTTERELSEPLTELAGDNQHHVYFNEFTMGLDPSDDQPGALITEFRVDDDGWHNYYGWATSPDLPFLFTPSGTNVDDLVYGSLGTGGLSKAPFEQFFGPDDPNGPFVPGFGTFTIAHRAIDDAGNHGTPREFVATVLPGEALECTTTITGNHRGRLLVDDGVTCLEGATVSGSLSVNGGSLLARGSVINGSVSTSGADAVHLFTTTVNGPSAIAGTASSVVIAGSELRGSVGLTGNTQLAGDDNAARFAEFGVDYGPIVVGSTVRGSLSCSGNSAPAYDFGASNVITGSVRGDCANL